ncbi:hypothetical protein UPYG_G00118220 [Umbra pygmaea]|uniref:Actinodin3 n=1 Tax=Umbra pygmaea TaxID=75934 RepID=A0ABD0X585_UMBPY
MEITQVGRVVEFRIYDLCSSLTLTLDIEERQIQVARMICQVLLTGAICALLPGLLDATPLMVRAEGEVSIESTQANDFLSQPRPKRNIDPKWYRSTPDFQAYYKFYNSIGHTEGLYEIDRIRILYQQMRHMEQLYGPDASSYQNALGVVTPPPTTTAPPTTQPPPTTPVPLSLTEANVLYLCNPKDPLCKVHIVYLPSGAVPVLCDPRHNPSCKPQSGKVVVAAAPVKPALAAPVRPAVRVALHPPNKSILPPPPAPVLTKGMEYDCDPYWDPDCLIDHPPRPFKVTQPPSPPPLPPVVELEEDAEEEAIAAEKTLAPFDPYDYRRDLFDPYRYSDPAPKR